MYELPAFASKAEAVRQVRLLVTWEDENPDCEVPSWSLAEEMNDVYWIVVSGLLIGIGLTLIFASR